MAQTHTIRQLALQLQLPRSIAPLPLQEKLRVYCHEMLLPKLEALFNEWVGEHEVLRIPRLEIELGRLSEQQLETALADQIIACMRERYSALKMGQATESGSIQKISLPEAQFSNWLYYLQQGYLPAHTAQQPPTGWEALVLETLASSSSAVDQCQRVLQGNAMALQRLVQQHDALFLGQWIAAFSGQRYRALMMQLTAWEHILYHPGFQALLMQHRLPLQLPTLASFREQHYHWILQRYVLPRRDADGFTLLTEILQRSVPAASRNAWLVVTQAALGGQAMPALREAPTFITAITPVLREAQPQLLSSITRIQQTEGGSQTAAATVLYQDVQQAPTAGPDTPSAPDVVADKALLMDTFLQQNNQTPEAAIDAGSALYIQQAGLVLVHPFLPAFFKDLGLVDGKTFKDEHCRYLAVHLLHFLASGNAGQPDHLLVLPKILCGMRPAQSLPRFVTLSPPLQEAAQSLLQDVIEHWNALGNTSPDGLRANFLLREGRLLEQQHEWRLRVNQQAYDLLLERLPWSFSIIRLPWMDQFLKTEWA